MRIPQKELDYSPLSPREPLHLVMQLGGITLSTIVLACRTPGVFQAVGFYLPDWVARVFFHDMTPFVISMRFASSFSIQLA